MPSETALPYSAMGLSDSEYKAIVDFLKREPTYTELGMFAVLWSEHCSYKTSKNVLKFFSNYKKAVDGDGLENAGIVPIGDNIGIAFKVESHNHPSAVEPYEGAATGVGGIIRDILTMGARPIASLNSLRFGDLSSAEDRRLFDGVVRGIGGYGNCIGVPTVAGEVAFHPRFSGNPLVNAMCIGRLDTSYIATAAAQGVGNPVLYLGSATGRDGIHGASFASEVLGEDSDAKRPNVQIGDPFAGKLLIEATLEALKTGAIVAIQDMGAAGLTCSTCEMSEKGGVGMDVDLDKVPLRDETMSSYEIMLSESQERMLAVVTSGRETEVLDVFHKWGLPAVVVGSVTGDGIVAVRHRGHVEARVPVDFICNGCPILDMQYEEPAYSLEAAAFSIADVPQPNYGDTLLQLLSSPTIASKRWVYEQYDSTVQTQTALKPGRGDAAVLALRDTNKGIATKIDCNSLATYFDPYTGGQWAMVEAARNVACTGARPAAATDCLNFGNPNKPHVYWQFREAVRGIADAAEALQTPILSGNVSFYNETDKGEVLPTPTIGVVGVLENAADRLPMGFPAGRGYIYLLFGEEHKAAHEGLGASEYLRTVHGIENGKPKPCHLGVERSIIDFMVGAAGEQMVDCAHDLSEGGLAVALAEMCIAGGCGAHALVDAGEHYQRHVFGPMLDKMQGLSQEVLASLIDVARVDDPWLYSKRMDARLFGEIPGRVLLGISTEKMKNIDRLGELARSLGLFLHPIGTFDSSVRYLQFMNPGGSVLKVSVDEIANAYEGAIPSLMG
jgi:phosphoribosylformylglycinamidine synthase